MSRRRITSINESMAQDVLLEPIRLGANKLIIISGYVSHNMASWHIKKISEQNLPPIDISLTVGMCQNDGLNLDIHEGLKELSALKDANYSSFDCKYIYQGSPVHSKVYIWMKDNIPFKAFAGSANYTQMGFSPSQREYVVECDPTQAYSYYQSIEGDTIVCNHNEIEEYICLKNNSKIDEIEQDHTLSSTDRITLSLLTSRGNIGFGSGINWGIRRNGTKREPNQAYIPVPAQVARSGFFPLNKAHFSAITDDHKQLIFRIEQAGDKALTTPLNNSLLGEYLRSRIGVPNGAFVTKGDLENYGRTDVTFYKIDDEQYYMDFSV